MNKYCVACNTARAKDDIYCYKCGNKLEVKITKCKCGNELDYQWDNFCSQCGEKRIDRKEG